MFFDEIFTAVGSYSVSSNSEQKIFFAPRESGGEGRGGVNEKILKKYNFDFSKKRILNSGAV